MTAAAVRKLTPGMPLVYHPTLGGRRYTGYFIAQEGRKVRIGLNRGGEVAAWPKHLSPSSRVQKVYQ